MAHPLTSGIAKLVRRPVAQSPRQARQMCRSACWDAPGRSSARRGARHRTGQHHVDVQRACRDLARRAASVRREVGPASNLATGLLDQIIRSSHTGKTASSGLTVSRSLVTASIAIRRRTRRSRTVFADRSFGSQSNISYKPWCTSSIRSEPAPRSSPRTR